MLRKDVREWIRKPFSFQPFLPLALVAIMLVILVEMSRYFYGISLGDWRFCASILSFSIAIYIGALIERFSIRSRILTLLCILFLLVSNIFYMLGLTFLLLTKSYVEFVVFLPFVIASIALSIGYSLRVAYNILRMGKPLTKKCFVVKFNRVSDVSG